MAKISEVSEAAIKVLGKAVTFSSWNGVPYVKAKPKKYPTPRSPRVQVMNRRFRICWKLINQMDDTVRDAYKHWTRGCTMTWKDLAVKEIMTLWQELGQTPLTLRHFDHTVVDGLLTINVLFNPIMTDEGNGYGLTGWGTSPWGSPQEFLEEDGYLTPARWQLAWGDPLPWPEGTYTY